MGDYEYTHDSSGNLLTGNKQNWGDTIWNIAIDDVPMLDDFQRDNSLNETELKYFVEKLEARDSSNSQARVQNSTPSYSTRNRYKVFNYTMILDDASEVSRTQEKQTKAGIDSELTHQMVGKMVTLKQSVEEAVGCRVKKRDPQAGSQAGLTSGIPGIVGENGDKIMHINDSSAQYGPDNTTNINNSVQSFDQNSDTGQDEFESMLKALAKLGAKPTDCYCGFDNKEYISNTWDITNVTRNIDEDESLKQKVSSIITDFGTVRFMPTLAFSRAGTTSGAYSSYSYDGESGNSYIKDFAVLCNPSNIKLMLFDDFFTEDMPKTSDGYKRRCLVEFSVKVTAPQGVGVFTFAGNSTYSPAKNLPTTEAAYTL